MSDAAPMSALARMSAWATPREAPLTPVDSEPPSGTCELCPIGLGDDHRHLLHLDERRIICVCETCWSMRSGDVEYRATGARTVWLDDFVMADDVWASFQIPIGLAFMMRSAVDGRVVTMYPSPAGATESELDLADWDRLVAANPPVALMEPDAEALIVNRVSTPHEYVIAPIDQAYKLVGFIKARWQGITGGSETEEAVAEFFTTLRERTESTMPVGMPAPPANRTSAPALAVTLHGTVEA